MNCKKCNTVNQEGAKFCIQCGSPLDTNNQGNLQTQQPINNMGVNMGQNPQMVNNMGMYANNQMYMTKQPFNLFLFLVKAFIKPTQTISENEKEIKDSKNAVLLGVLSVLFAVIISILNKAITVANVVTNYPWMKAIATDLLFYSGIVFGVALIFYLGSLIVKKEINYLKVVSITSVALLPSVLAIYVLGPLLGEISYYLQYMTLIIGVCYSVVLFNNAIKDEIKLEKDARVYFNFICYTLIVLIICFVLYKITIASYVDAIYSYFR